MNKVKKKLIVFNILVFTTLAVSYSQQSFKLKMYDLIKTKGYNKVNEQMIPEGMFIKFCGPVMHVDPNEYRGHLIGEYKNGKQEGLWIHFWKERVLSELKFKDGYLHGIASFYHGNQKLDFQATFLQGKLEGEYRGYDNKGNIAVIYECSENLVIDIIFKSNSYQGKLFKIGDEPFNITSAFCGIISGYRPN